LSNTRRIVVDAADRNIAIKVDVARDPFLEPQRDTYYLGLRDALRRVSATALFSPTA